ncbi:hypothetical protein SUGI_0420170 [Cryptomeria japonica]|nr:hypothetical protein SUGI_0420170 [Cryptomeria japonica]
MQTKSVDNETKIVMQKTKSNVGEIQIDSVVTKQKTKSECRIFEDHESETLKISTEIQGTRTERGTKSTDTGLKESEPESETLMDSKSTKAQNTINIDLKEQAQPLANSKVSMNPELKSIVNSMGNETNGQIRMFK